MTSHGKCLVNYWQYTLQIFATHVSLKGTAMHQRASKYIDKLEKLKDRLKYQHNVEKTEDYIIDQFLRVVILNKSPYEIIVDQLKFERDKGTLNLGKVKKCLNGKYKEFTIVIV